MRGGTRPGAGRKPVKIDLIELEKLCVLHSTDEDLAYYFGVSIRTIENRKKQWEFAQAMARGKAKGRLSVRRAQMKLLESGNVVMAIWLGKQLLGQRDTRPIELSGPNGNPLQLSLEAFDAIVANARKRKKTTKNL
jgi:hypothetical protein